MINVEFDEKELHTIAPLVDRAEYKAESPFVRYLSRYAAIGTEERAKKVAVVLFLGLLIFSGVIATQFGNGSRLKPSELMSRVRSNEGN